MFHCLPQVMADGHLLGLSPGGVYEAQFGDNHNRLLWRERLGFARAAIAADCPVVPVFTENCRESYRVFKLGRRCVFLLNHVCFG